MIEELLNEILGWIDGTSDNDVDNDDFKVIEREKIKKLRRLT